MSSSHSILGRSTAIPSMVGNLADVGARLTRERERLGHNQADFARLGGVSRNSQSAYETGRTAANVDYLQAIEDAGVDLTYVFWGRHQGDRLSREETELVACFAAISPDARGPLLAVAQSMAGRLTPGRRHSPPAEDLPARAALPPVPALARMFEALLAIAPAGASPPELARELATNLATGLEQLQDLDPTSPGLLEDAEAEPAAQPSYRRAPRT